MTRGQHGIRFPCWTNKRRKVYDAPMDEGRKRVLGYADQDIESCLS